MDLARANIETLDDASQAIRRLNLLVPVAWQPYSVAWTIATGSAPAIGDGILEARYLRNAAMCFVSLLLSAGASTTFGSTNDWWYFSLPATAAASGNMGILGSGVVTDASANVTYGAFPEVLGGAEAFYIRTTGGMVKKNGPMAAWASGDQVRVTLCYPTQS